MRKLNLPLSMLMLLIGILVHSCQKNELVVPKSLENESTPKWEGWVPVSWYKLEMKLIKETPGFSPPIAARAIAYTGIALHEAVVAGKENGKSLSGQLDGLQYSLSKEDKHFNSAVVSNAALATIIRNLFANTSLQNMNLINELEAKNFNELSANESHNRALEASLSTEATYSNEKQSSISESVDMGKNIAEIIFNWSKSDGGHEAYLRNFPTDYIPPVGDGLWIPTPTLNQKAMLPYWGNNRLLVKANQQVEANASKPPVYSTDNNSDFYKEANAVYLKGKSITETEKEIALYWADGGGTFTPPGHLIGITTQLIEDNQLNLEKAATLYAQVGIALNDAGITCWKCKFTFNVLRPVTYIQRNIDPAWMPLIETPPFPSFSSGHSSFSGATGPILTNHFGKNYKFTDRQKMPQFQPRTFNSFEEIVDEAANSRFYAGIHYQFDNNEGKASGKLIAEKVLNLKY